MRSWISALLTASAIVLAPAWAGAASLQIMPINIEVPAPGAASKVTISNTGSEAANIQIRVFKWLQENGKDELVETRDVVASPPAVKLGAGKKSVIRVVRVNKSPAAHEESYRLVIDEIAPPPKASDAGVGFSVRHSLPVFFTAADSDAQLNWKATVKGGQLTLQASNSGGRRVRLAGLQVAGKTGKSVSFGTGLSGYVLGQSTRTWTAKAKSIAPGTVVTILAQGDNGPIEATAKVQ